ncbi:alpha-hydroxy-acid oxidizing protein [Thiomicrorhabdus sp. 6S2-11]|uniref:Alpha-hydroxy-acid oxidizing protein n=1 Tax=Thiomicrorhabdus marina TaxID=2818442 RepID=A0ABS3Q695_9GAMM|nr:alpha-hydroxy acid oxidase [Thiomicrorhabdus marina]MBO1927852.1 alpha-hydroxy-acid oxidizing protein [Thiomicrorhabdus marina]
MITDYQQLQRQVLCAQDFETLAQTQLDEALFAYIAGGSGREISLQRNLQAFSNVRLLPNSLQNVAQGSSAWYYKNHRFSAPIFLAPVAHQRLLNEQAEIASAQGAEAIEQGMILSTFSSYSLEEVAQASAGWQAFQLYHQPRIEDSMDLIRRAKQAGYQALVITVDAPVQSVSLQARKLGFQLPQALPPNLEDYPNPSVELAKDESYIFQGIMSQALNWQTLTQLIEFAKNLEIEVWIKGVLNPQQALRLQQLGVDALIVSNHGGRALDQAPSSLQMLPKIRQAVGAEMTILLDSGIRSGQDIFTALANGADAVMIGRLQVYALAVAGALGVAHLLKVLTEELQMTMALCGCASLHEINATQILESADV